jgi:hypothetical protein
MTSLLNLRSGEDTDSKAHIVRSTLLAGLSRRAATNITQLRSTSQVTARMRLVVHPPSASPTTSGGSGQSSVSQMARSSSPSRTVTCWFARMQAVQATTIRRLMAGTD